jgi:riboflavin synthase
MFTGIIQGIGTVLEKRPAGGGMLFRFEADFDLSSPEEGESIAVNGVCLTARNFQARRFVADVSPESLTRTHLGTLTVGNRVNLERALRLHDRLGGHLVSGHVDTLARVEERRTLGDFTLFSFALDPKFTRYVIEKGSIAINGISLTVNTCTNRSFSVSIIPHTLAVTTLGTLQPGESVNIEVDLIGKYVEKLLSVQSPEAAPSSRINPAFLAAHGFLK